MIYLLVSNCFGNGARVYYNSSSVGLVNSGSTSLISIEYSSMKESDLIGKLSVVAEGTTAEKKMGIVSTISNTSVSNYIDMPANFSYNGSASVKDNQVYKFGIFGQTENGKDVTDAVSTGKLYFWYYGNETYNNTTYFDESAAKNGTLDLSKYSSFIIVRDTNYKAAGQNSLSWETGMKKPDGSLDYVDQIRFGKFAVYYQATLLKSGVETVTQNGKSITRMFRLYGIPANNIGTKTISWTTGALWWKKTYSASVPLYKHFDTVRDIVASSTYNGDFVVTDANISRNNKGFTESNADINLYGRTWQDTQYLTPHHIYCLDLDAWPTSYTTSAGTFKYLTNYQDNNWENFHAYTAVRNQGFFFNMDASSLWSGSSSPSLSTLWTFATQTTSKAAFGKTTTKG